MMNGAARAEAERLGDTLVQLTRRPEARTEDPVPLLGQVPADQLVEMACHHRVPGVVYRSMTELGVDDEAYADLRVAYQMASLAHGRCLLELASMVGTLSTLDQPWLVVKGPVLTEIGYRDPGARLYEDLDLVVAASDVAGAISRIESAGGHVTDLNWPMMVELRRAEIPMILPTGMLGDLHWHLLVTPNIRSRFRISMDELMERRRVVPMGGTEVATLDVIDGLMYLCLHGSLSGGHQLVWLKDLDQMVAGEPTDWDELIRRARLSGTELVVGMQLERARSVLGAPVPPEVIDTLAGGEPWWKWWQRRERQVGPARWGGYAGTGRTYVAATSGGSLSSAGQLLRSMGADVVRPSLAHRLRLNGADPLEESPRLYRPMGDAADRTDYLQLVAAGDWDKAQPVPVAGPATTA
jgi:hypothetical protein